ncbi:MAG TPA: hypothetical protein VFX51_11010 [Solirubrobacteraceae bacterium]|nr:hypothetical protein [Solirubrobacteraceae bacterium]
MSLQQTVGNRAVTDILARDPKEKAPPKPPADQFKEAVKSKSWAAAAKALNDVPDADVQGLLKPLKEDQLKSLDAASGKLPDLTYTKRMRTHRHIVFLHRPAVTIGSHADDFTVKGGGKAEPGVKAGGGDVTVRTGLTGKAKTDEAGDDGERVDAVSMGYSGKDADKTRWIQFIAREILVPATDKDKGKDRYIPGSVKADAGRKYALTTDPYAKVWNTDVAEGAATPFYEETGYNNRTADGTTIFDTPTAVGDVVGKQLKAGAKRVISRAYLVGYLVRDMDVLHRVMITLEWSFSAPKAQSPTTSVTQGAASELDAVHQQVLQKQYPKFAYLP